MTVSRLSAVVVLCSGALQLLCGCAGDPSKSEDRAQTGPEESGEADLSDDADDDEGGGDSAAPDEPGDDELEVVPTFFAASDVSAATLDIISGAVEVADDVWFTTDAGGRDQFDPIYIAVVGDDVDAAIAAESAFCGHLASEHPDFHATSRCNRSPPGCAIGVCYFADLAGSTAASISSMRSVEGFHLMILTADLADHGASVMEQIVLHESFHIFQLSHSTSTDYDQVEAQQGRMTADHDELVPWWMEGTAEYMAVTTYGREVSDDPDYVRTDFRNKLGYYDEASGAQVVEDYFEAGVKLYNIPFGDDAWTAYALGAWLVAWLVDTHGEAAVFDFYNAVDTVPFEENFETCFGQDYRSAVDAFEVFLSQPPDELLALLD